MKKWIMIAVALAFSVSGLAFAAQGWGPGWGHGFGRPDPGSMSRRLLALLNDSRFQSAAHLTDDQVTHLRHIVTGAEKSNIELGAKMRVDGIDLSQLLQEHKPDQAAVMKKVEEISALRGQMMKNSVTALLDAKAVLSPEQQEQVRQFIWERFRDRSWGPQRMERHRGRMQTRSGTPPAPPSAPAPPAPPGN